jgi:hypothetical protein
MLSRGWPAEPTGPAARLFRRRLPAPAPGSAADPHRSAPATAAAGASNTLSCPLPLCTTPPTTSPALQVLNLPSSLAYPLFHKLAAKGEERVAPGALLQWASAHNLCGVPDARRAFDILRQVRACVCACVCEELCPSQAHRTGEGVSVCVCVAGIGLPVQSWAVIAAGRLCLAAPPIPCPPTTLPCHDPSPAHIHTCPHAHPCLVCSRLPPMSPPRTCGPCWQASCCPTPVWSSCMKRQSSRSGEWRLLAQLASSVRDRIGD